MWQRTGKLMLNKLFDCLTRRDVNHLIAAIHPFTANLKVSATVVYLVNISLCFEMTNTVARILTETTVKEDPGETSLQVRSFNSAYSHISSH